jgi:four helix bundle protein
MGVRRFEDLEVWKLGMELCCEVAAVTRQPDVWKDRRFCQQICDASVSVPANIAEGFGRYGLRDFLRSLAIARGSLAETQTLLMAARARGYLSAERCDELLLLSRRTGGALAALMRSLRAQLDRG